MSAKVKVSRWKRWKEREGIRNAEFSQLQNSREGGEWGRGRVGMALSARGVTPLQFL